jgi:hypothetical protein
MPITCRGLALVSIGISTPYLPGFSFIKSLELCYVTPVTGHKAYTGKEEEEEKKTLK